MRITGWLAMAGLAAGALVLPSQPASAGFPVQVKMKCPVGGKKVTHTTTGSYSTFGSRPDGKPYGSWEFPLALPECPDNKLVLYREFEKAELPRLKALIASPEYRALAGETSYYRAQWLSDRLDGDAAEPWLLLSATWQVDADPARKVRYQAEFAERAARVPVYAATVSSVVLRFRQANALRELGRFTEAHAALGSIPAEALRFDPAQLEADDYDLRNAARSRQALAEQVPVLAELIALNDTSSEPLRLIPEDVAVFTCAERMEDGGPDADPFCRDPARQAAIKEARDMIEAR